MGLGVPPASETKAKETSVPAGAVTPSENTLKKFEKWTSKLGLKTEELTKLYGGVVAQLQKLYPKQPQEWLDNRARHLMATKFAEQLSVRAEAFVVSWVFDGGKVNTNANAIEQAKLMYNNPETRDEAVAQGLCFADGRPRDGRQFLVQPAAGVRGRKNPNYDKELKPFWQRRVIGFGRKFDEEEKIVRVIVATLRGEQADLDIPRLTPVKMRMNIRVSDNIRYGLTSSTKTEVEKIEDALLSKIDDGWVFKMLDGAPAFNTETKNGIKTSIFNIVEFCSAHKGDAFAVTVLEADITRLPDEPTVTGNWPIGVGDVEEDVEARGITCFTPDAIFKKKVEGLGSGSRLLWIGTPREGVDIFTDEKTATLNVVEALVKTAITKEESLFEIGAEVSFSGEEEVEVE